ncbi:MAG: energy transducer TonB, partial [Sporomusa sp.]
EPPAEGGGGAVQAESTGGGAATAQASSGKGAAVGTGSGARQGGADIDGIIRAFIARIERNKTYPYMARQRGQTGTVTVAVRLTAAGDLAEARVIKSSGIAVLDQEAIKLVRRVCPFRHNAGRPLAMNIPIVYNLN